MTVLYLFFITPMAVKWGRVFVVHGDLILLLYAHVIFTLNQDQMCDVKGAIQLSPLNGLPCSPERFSIFQLIVLMSQRFTGCRRWFL